MADAPSKTQAVHALWDALADIETSRVEPACKVLLQGLCTLVAAQNASWVGVVRMDHARPGDPVRGWRPGIIRRLHDSPLLEATARRQKRGLEAGRADEVMVRNVSFAGSWRTNRLVDLVPPEWFDGDCYRDDYLARDWFDAIWSGVPINEDMEIYFGVYRASGQPMFSEADRDVIAQALRGLLWFHRQQVLGHGLGLGSMPLTELEHRVLSGLLSGLTDKQIAAREEMSPRTANEYASRIYRKYGVGNRTALMALWLGQGGN